MKEYPLRPRTYSPTKEVNVCECGHSDHNHNTSDMVLLSYPPQYIYLECRECMCPEYKHEKSYTERLPC